MEIQLADNTCTGCGVCVSICPKQAISMKERQDGFLYPVIDSSVCVRCGQCMHSCHAITPPEKHIPKRCYAAVFSKDPTILRKSSSGGVFYVLAKTTLACGGVVYGCVYDKFYRAKITRADTIDAVVPMHGSKYVWSDPSESYPQVKMDLEAGKRVLYTGMPCQVAGLHKYLGRPYDLLYTVDVLCGASPSPYAFACYLETLTKNTEFLCELGFQFRDKEIHGAGVDCTYTLRGKKHHENYFENSFYYAFSSKCRMTWRTSCYTCQYKDSRRVSALTIGDYWGVEKHHPSFDPKAGVSVILINTEHGEALFQEICGDLVTEETQLCYVTERNSLVDNPGEGDKTVPPNRESFFRTLHEKGWRVAEKRYLMDDNRKELFHKQRKRRMHNLFK